jgi:hypothetical protein
MHVSTQPLPVCCTHRPAHASNSTRSSTRSLLTPTPSCSTRWRPAASRCVSCPMPLSAKEQPANLALTDRTASTHSTGTAATTLTRRAAPCARHAHAGHVGRRKGDGRRCRTHDAAPSTEVRQQFRVEAAASRGLGLQTFSAAGAGLLVRTAWLVSCAIGHRRTAQESGREQRAGALMLVVAGAIQRVPQVGVTAHGELNPEA